MRLLQLEPCCTVTQRDRDLILKLCEFGRIAAARKLPQMRGGILLCLRPQALSAHEGTHGGQRRHA
jgi:hypothetical protein